MDNKSFKQKFDFLMTLTSTRNSDMAKILSFDPSYIGRIRRGERGIPLHAPFVEPASRYFARKLTDEHKLGVLSDIAFGGRNLATLETDRLAGLISEWLSSDDDMKGNDAIHGLFDGLRLAMSSKPRQTGYDSAEEPSVPDFKELTGTGALYGNAGKRDAVLIFLNNILAQGKPLPIYLYSDEDFSWLYDEPTYVRQWSALLIKVMGLGCEIKIVHTVSRNIHEMMEAIQKWMPLYTFGKIKPYYYPRMRDEVYGRTLFIASGHSAVVSSSVFGKTDGMVNLLFSDKSVVGALEAEYMNYFSACRPLMRFYSANERETLLQDVGRFKRRHGETLTYTDGSERNIIVLAKEDVGVFVFYTAVRFAAFYFDEPRMTAAFTEFLIRNPGRDKPSELIRFIQESSFNVTA